MCLIAICQNRKMSDNEIRNAFINNDDGVGIGYYKDNLVKYKKGFMKSEDFKNFYRSFDVIPHVIHFRKKTDGEVCPELTHPFIIDATSRISLEYSGTDPILFHNGIHGDWEQELIVLCLINRIKIPAGPWSDSRFIAMSVHYLGTELLSLIKGKFVVIDNKSISYYGDFEEEKGILFSNSTHSYRIVDTYKKYVPDYFNWR